MEKIVLAYSGGLDTSTICKWLCEQGKVVHCMCFDLGQNDDFEEIKKKGLKSGAKEVEIVDVKKEFVKEYLFPLIHWNALYEGSYPLGTSIARSLIAKKQVEKAISIKSNTVAHGACDGGTGGAVYWTDGIRLETNYRAFKSDIKVITPWILPEFNKQFPDRDACIDYCRKNNIPIGATKKNPWSHDENIANRTYCAGEIDDPWLSPPDDARKWVKKIKDTPNKSKDIVISFEEGSPISIDGEKIESYELLNELNILGGNYGVGFIDMVENKIVGPKGRDLYESPGMLILIKAHKALESLVLDQRIMRLKEDLTPYFSRNVFDGFWFGSDIQALLKFVKETQMYVTGDIRMNLHKGNYNVTGRKSPYSVLTITDSIEKLYPTTGIAGTGYNKMISSNLSVYNLQYNKLRKSYGNK